MPRRRTIPFILGAALLCLISAFIAPARAAEVPNPHFPCGSIEATAQVGAGIMATLSWDIHLPNHEGADSYICFIRQRNHPESVVMDMAVSSAGMTTSALPIHPGGLQLEL